MSRIRHRAGARAATAVALSLLVLLPAAASGAAQDAARFVPVADVVAKPMSGRVLFFPLADELAACAPLTGPCVEHSLPIVIVPAAGRRVAWTPEGTRLPESAAAVPPLPALGSPPPRPESARYLVPVLDGAGVGLSFVARRLEGVRLVAPPAPSSGAGAGTTEGTDAVPVLAGPDLGVAPTGRAATRVVDRPVEVDADELTDVVAALLVRRAAPARVVFGVETEGGTYVPLVDERGVAAVARRGGTVGLVARAPEGIAGEGPSDAGPGRDRPGGDDGVPGPLVAAVGAVLVAVLVAVAVRRARRRPPTP